MRKLETFLSRLPTNVKQLVIRAGDTRKSEELCGHIDYDLETININDTIEEILDMLPIPEMKFRCLAINEAGKQIKG